MFIVQQQQQNLPPRCTFIASTVIVSTALPLLHTALPLLYTAPLPPVRLTAYAAVGFLAAAGALMLMPAAKGYLNGVAATTLTLGALGFSRWVPACSSITTRLWNKVHICAHNVTYVATMGLTWPSSTSSARSWADGPCCWLSLSVLPFAALCLSCRGGFSVNHMDIAPKYAGVVMGISNTAGEALTEMGGSGKQALLPCERRMALATCTCKAYDSSEKKNAPLYALLLTQAHCQE